MQRVALILLVGLVGGGAASAQMQTNDPMAEARKLLHKTMQEFLEDPDAADRVRASIAAGARATASTPARPAVDLAASGVPVGQAVPAPPPALQPLPERSFAEMERLYLDGKISAKEFQKYLRNQKLRSVRAESTPPAPATAPAPASAPTAQPPSLTATNLPGALPPSPAEGTLVDVERRLEELIRAQEAREKAATNQPTSPPELKTQRQKLDYILKQLIEGKISEEEYKALRKKITEADPQQ